MQLLRIAFKQILDKTRRNIRADGAHVCDVYVFIRFSVKIEKFFFINGVFFIANTAKQFFATDFGKVIGKQGRIAKAIRSVVKAAASKSEKKVVVDIV